MYSPECSCCTECACGMSTHPDVAVVLGALVVCVLTQMLLLYLERSWYMYSPECCCRTESAQAETRCPRRPSDQRGCRRQTPSYGPLTRRMPPPASRASRGSSSRYQSTFLEIYVESLCHGGIPLLRKLAGTTSCTSQYDLQNDKQYSVL